jgi:hypothetical protein
VKLLVCDWDNDTYGIILTGQIGTSVKLLSHSVDKCSSERAPFVFNVKQVNDRVICGFNLITSSVILRSNLG